MIYKSYQHIEKLGTSETEGILKGEVHLSYKIDGSNGCIYLKDNFELMLKKYKDPTINFKLLRQCSNDFVKEIIGV